jgi:hypothetical protein
MFMLLPDCDVYVVCDAADVETCNLSLFEPAAIACTVKKYLRQLPNPVIPEELYTNFIDAASL